MGHADRRLDPEMRILIFQHIACEHPGTFREFMRDDGVDITAKTVTQWGQIPENATALVKALGDGALSRLKKDVGKQAARFKDISKQRYTSFMAVVRQA